MSVTQSLMTRFSLLYLMETRVAALSGSYDARNGFFRCLAKSRLRACRCLRSPVQDNIDLPVETTIESLANTLKHQFENIQLCTNLLLLL